MRRNSAGVSALADCAVALGVFATGHLQAVGRAGKLHVLGGAAIDRLQRDAAATEQIGGAGQHVKGGDAAGQRPGKAGILRPAAHDGAVGFV
jgi:hypothetical protein